MKEDKEKSDRDRLNEVIKDFDSITERLISLVPVNGSIRVPFSKDEFSESFSSIVSMIEIKFDYYKRQLKRVSDKMPSGKKPRKTRSDVGKRRNAKS